MITCRLYRDGRLAEEGSDPRLVSDRLAEPEGLIWLDAADPTDEELRLIEEEFGLHPLAVEDARHRNQRPKLESYEAYDFLVAHEVTFDGVEVANAELHAFVAPRFLVTLRFPPVGDLRRALAWANRHPDLVREGGGALLYALLDRVVDGYFLVVDAFEDRTDEVESEVFAEDTNDDVQRDIFRLKKQVIEFRRLAAPLREVLNLVQATPAIVTPPLTAYYRDVADHLIRTLEFVDNVRELLGTALDAHLSQVSNRLNEVMKAVTSWGAIILVPTLIAGIYGMNFRHMPELSWLLGYPAALGLMALSAGALFVAFKRRGWL
ncbi:MAG TPA: magnesium/cobalt transporter CorA [Actinomycetota bacterium]|nr:magnesium/cobalt transporter CorA [Actinomycetota bacterium]